MLGSATFIATESQSHYILNTPTIFNSASILNGGKLLKQRICSSRSKFLPLRVDPFWNGSVVQEKVTEAVSLCKMAYKHVALPIHLTFSVCRWTSPRLC